MSPQEEWLLFIIRQIEPDKDRIAIFVQSFISEEGPLSEEAATKVRKILGGKNK